MKKLVAIFSCLIICLSVFVSCEPIYPLGDIKIEKIEYISIGESHDVEIIYPTGGMCVIGWKNQKIEIISGEDIISVSGIAVTGLKSGTALIKISAITVLDEHAIEAGDKEKEYSFETEIRVK